MGVSFDDGRLVMGRREPGFMAKDPVCGGDVEIARAGGSSDHAGHTFYFCSSQCKEQFERHPDVHVNR